jgi:hypothetical protein
MWAVAKALLSAAPNDHIFTEPDEGHEARYIPLSVQVSKGTTHKNAVSVHHDYVSFMVADWTVEPSVRAAGFRTMHSTRYGKRLHVFGITPAAIEDSPVLFQALLFEADKESRDRQRTKPRKGHQ